MDNRNATSSAGTQQSVLFQPRRWNPAGDFTATYVSTRAGWRYGVVHPDHVDSICHAPLAGLHHAYVVVITGIVDEVHLQGTDDKPRAMVILDSDTGAQAIIDFDQTRYNTHWGDLVQGHIVRITGEVRRPLDDYNRAINTGPLFIRAHELSTEAGAR